MKKQKHNLDTTSETINVAKKNRPVSVNKHQGIPVAVPKTAFVKQGKMHTSPKLHKLKKTGSLSVKSRPYPHRYVLFSLFILFASCIFWSALSAGVHHGNADQIVNTYLFENQKTFHEALFPSSHTFLIKWPIFLLISFAGASAFSFTLFTILLCLITVGSLAAMLYRINSRPFVFGTLCLSMASVLMLIPPEPYSGGILPVNMGMLATRNVEYVLYIFALYLLVKAVGYKDRYFLGGIICMVLLGASDKLFLTLSLGGSVMAVVSAIVMRRWTLLKVALRWIVASGIAWILASFVLRLINVSGVTHIAPQIVGGPYGFVHSLKNLALGGVFGLLGLLTTFGANPAFDAQILRKIPLLARHRLFSSAGLAYISNGFIFITSVFMTLRTFIVGVHRPKINAVKLDVPYKLACMLIFSSFAAAGAFVLSDHYYVVDSRYLAITFFAVFTSAAVYMRSKNVVKSKRLVALVTIIILSILSGLSSSLKTYHEQQGAQADIYERNSRVVQSVIYHPVSVVVGDYWRVIPIKDARPKSLAVMPMETCTTPRDVLSSANWQKDLSKQSFAYLLSFDKSLTNFPHCSIKDVVKAYGRPNSSVLISGSLENPKELLLFYDQGAHNNGANFGATLNTQTILPIRPAQITSMACRGKPVILNFVAHQDDDLLFLSPDLISNLDNGDCVRTVYLTAGDAGSDKLYWQARERGSQAAYTNIIKSSEVWVQKTVKLSDGHFVTVANPKGNPRVSLLFLRLPDGNPSGYGFKVSNFESLERLKKGQINIINSVDGQSVYNSTDLVSALADIMAIYMPTEIHAQSPINASKTYPDHSDHLAVGDLVAQALHKYDTSNTVAVKYYIGYPIRNMPINLNPDEISRKTAAFLDYAKYDGSVCHSTTECANLASYGSYLRRQYQAVMP